MRPILSLSLLTCIACLPALAQLDRGAITGTVTDPSGAAVPGVHVFARNTATGAQVRDGDYRSGPLYPAGACRSAPTT